MRKNGDDTSEPLNVGLILAGDFIPSWQRQILTNLSEHSVIKISFVLDIGSTDLDAQGPSARLQKVIDRGEDFLSRKLFHRGMTRRGLQVDKLVSIKSCFHEVARLEHRPDMAEDAILEFSSLSLAEQGLDQPELLLNFTNHVPGRSLAELSKEGVLNIQFEDNPFRREDLPGFRPFYDADPVSTAGIVQYVVARDTNSKKAGPGKGEYGQNLLVQGAYRTFALSWNENRRRLCWKAAWLMIDAVKQLARARNSEAPVSAKADRRDMTTPPAFYVRGGRQLPGLTETSVALLKIVWRVLAKLAFEFTREHRWRLLVSTHLDRKPGRQLTRIEGRPGSFWADPFPLIWDGKRYIFFEEYPFKTKKGIISMVELPEETGEDISSMELTARTVIEQDCHLSYPFLFEYEGQLFMIPETGGRKTIELWEPVGFPLQWRRKKHLMQEVSAAETTLVEYEGRWWMFTNIDQSGMDDHCSELHIFWADNPLTDQWQAHQQNPVVRDARRARMAGNFQISQEGRLIRSCQASGSVYGKKIEACEITVLNEHTYAERPVFTIEPDWDPDVDRTHHIGRWQELIVLDGHYSEWKWNRK